MEENIFDNKEQSNTLFHVLEDGDIQIIGNLTISQSR